MASQTTTTAKLSPLLGTIDNLKILGKSISVKPPAVSDYDGRQLYLKYSVHSVAGTSTLVVAIDENGPDSALPGTAATAAVINISFGGTPAPPVNLSTINYTGQALHLTASVTPSASAPMWDQASFTLELREGPPVMSGNPAGYVIIQTDDASPTYQLRWVENPVFRGTPPDQAQVIPPVPNTIGISGPFGIEGP